MNSTIFRLLCLVAGLASSSFAHAGVLDQVVRRAVVQRAERAAALRILERDAARDAAKPSVLLPRARNVARYTSRAEANREAKTGVPAGVHVTSSLPRGRLPTPATAARTYGLKHSLPQVRMIIALPRGQAVRHARVLGGAAGKGEIRIDRRLSPRSIQRVQQLPKGRLQ